MKFKLKCKHCQYIHNVSTEHIGKSATCKCGKKLIITDPNDRGRKRPTKKPKTERSAQRRSTSRKKSSNNIIILAISSVAVLALAISLYAFWPSEKPAAHTLSFIPTYSKNIVYLNVDKFKNTRPELFKKSMESSKEKIKLMNELSQNFSKIYIHTKSIKQSDIQVADNKKLLQDNLLVVAEGKFTAQEVKNILNANKQEYTVKTSKPWTEFVFKEKDLPIIGVYHNKNIIIASKTMYDEAKANIEDDEKGLREDDALFKEINSKASLTWWVKTRPQMIKENKPASPQNPMAILSHIEEVEFSGDFLEEDLQIDIRADFDEQKYAQQAEIQINGYKGMAAMMLVNLQDENVKKTAAKVLGDINIKSDTNNVQIKLTVPDKYLLEQSNKVLPQIMSDSQKTSFPATKRTISGGSSGNDIFSIGTENPIEKRDNTPAKKVKNASATAEARRSYRAYSKNGKMVNAVNAKAIVTLTGPDAKNAFAIGPVKAEPSMIGDTMVQFTKKDKDEFELIKRSEGSSFNHPLNGLKCEIYYGEMPKKAKEIKLVKGSVLALKGGEEKIVILKNVLRHPQGKINDPILKELGINANFERQDQDDSINFNISIPKNFLNFAGLKLFDENGEELESNGSGSFSFNNTASYSLSLEKEQAKNINLHIYFRKNFEKVEIPFMVQNVKF